jgi:hypothetical protein
MSASARPCPAGGSPLSPVATDVTSAAKVRSDLSVALDILYRPASSFAHRLVMTRDPAARVIPLKNSAAVEQAFTFRTMLGYVARRAPDQLAPASLTSLLELCAVPSFSVATAAADGGVKSTSVGSALAEIQIHGSAERPIASPAAPAAPPIVAVTGELMAGYYVQDDASGERLFIFHSAATSDPAQAVTLLIYSSFPTTSTRTEIVIACNTELFLDGLLEPSVYYTRSFVQSIPCICCGSPPYHPACNCVDVGFPHPRHPLDFSHLRTAFNAHCVEATVTATATFLKSSSHCAIPRDLVRYRSWWESEADQLSAPHARYSLRMSAMLRCKSEPTTGGPAYSRTPELVRRAVRELTSSSPPPRAVRCVQDACLEAAHCIDRIERGKPSPPPPPPPPPPIRTGFSEFVATTAAAQTLADSATYTASERQVPPAATVVRGAAATATTAGAPRPPRAPCKADPGTAGTGDEGVKAGRGGQALDDKHVEREEQRRLRRQRNRASAAKSNSLRKERNEKLKNDVAAARVTIARLKARQEALVSENLALKSRASALWKAQLHGQRGNT